jgi:hypothetical protein
LDTIAKMEQQKLRCMIELGAPAAGATAVSPAVDISLPMLDTDLFQLSVGKIILSMQKQDSAGFYRV